MAEVGIDISGQYSKSVSRIPAETEPADEMVTPGGANARANGIGFKFPRRMHA